MKALKHFAKNEQMTVISDKSKEIYYKYLLSDEKFIKKRFYKRLGREVNLQNPLKYNDKLQWLKVNWYDPIAVKYADKYEVRRLVSEKIGSKYLNELYEVYDSLDDFDINKLPNSFVLKGTHGSGYNIICKDKNTMNWDFEVKKMKKWLKKNYFWQNREWVYKDIKPRIICEKLIIQENSEELRDYRFFCFNGEPKFITIDFSINDKQKTRRNLYDLDWKMMEEEISYPKELEIIVEKPKKLDEMIEISKKLSKGFPHSRIDFYYINERIIFGEVTFFHQSGMGNIRPLEFEEEMGKWITLPKTT